jgi:membrane protein
MAVLRQLQHEFRSIFFDDEPGEVAGWSRWRRVTRFWVMVGQAFARNRCPVRATALAYSSLLAFVPLLAVVIGISTSLLKKDADKIGVWITDAVFRVAPQLKSSEEFGLKLGSLTSEINNMISNVHSGAVGTTGVIALLTMILFMLARVEETLNDIWGVMRGRSWYSRMVNYWAAISLGPVLIFTAIGFTATLRLPQTEAWLGSQGVLGPFLVGMVQVPVLGAACALFYGLMPNTRVQWQAAAVGGLTAGFLWYLNNTLSSQFVSQVTRDKAIYGPVAVIPVFMIGLYFFWMLLLFGAQTAYTFQNRRSYLAMRQVNRIHQAGRELVAVRILVTASDAFLAGRAAPSIATLADQLEVPGQLVSQIIGTLLKTSLVVEVNQAEAGFFPSRPPELIKVSDVLGAMRRGVGSRMATRQDGGRQAVERELNAVTEAEELAGRRTLAELAKEASSRRAT